MDGDAAALGAVRRGGVPDEGISGRAAASAIVKRKNGSCGSTVQPRWHGDPQTSCIFDCECMRMPYRYVVPCSTVRT